MEHGVRLLAFMHAAAAVLYPAGGTAVTPGKGHRHPLDLWYQSSRCIAGRKRGFKTYSGRKSWEWLGRPTCSCI